MEENRPAEREALVIDAKVEGCLEVKTVRSPLHRGRLLGIEFPRMPRGYRSVVASDIPGVNGLRGFDEGGPDLMPILAEGELRYRGEPLALIVGPDPVLLESLVAATRVEAEELPAKLDAEGFSSDRVMARRSFSAGDPEMAFSVAEAIIEGGLSSGPQDCLASEPAGALARFDYDKLSVSTATQWPFHVRDAVAQAIGCDISDVVAKATGLGVHLEGKLWYPSLVACHAALAAFLTGKPARLVLSRVEDFLFSPKSATVSIRYRAGIGADGGLSALDAQIVACVGAYGPLAEELLAETCRSAILPYACPNLRIDGFAVSADLPPRGPLAGLGSQAPRSAVEALVNRVAERSGEGPIEWRTKRILGKGSPLSPGDRAKEGPRFAEIAARLAAASDFDRKHASYDLVRKRGDTRADSPPRGIGFAFAPQFPARFLSSRGGSSMVEAMLDKDLRLWIRTSAVPGNAGTRAVWKATASLALGIELEDVLVNAGPTDRVPDSGPSGLSRNLTVVNGLIEKCCASIAKRRFREPLPLSAKAASRPPKAAAGEGAFGPSSSEPSWAGAVLELELDESRLEPVLKGLWICVDAGRIASESHARSALETGCIAALGSCLGERFGSSANGVEDFLSYSPLSAPDCPPIHVDFLPPAKKAAFRGVGELPFACVPGAFVTALSQALDEPVPCLPYPLDLSLEAGGRS